MPVKRRYQIALGLQGKESSWDVPNLPRASFGGVAYGASAVIAKGLIILPPGTNSRRIGANDPLGDSLAAASGGRNISTGKAPFGTLLAAWIFSQDETGAVFTPASGTLKIRVFSANLTDTMAGATDLTAAFDLTTISTVWTQMTLTVPTERQPVPEGTLITDAASLFYGDAVIAEFTAAGGGTTFANKQFDVILEAA